MHFELMLGEFLITSLSILQTIFNYILYFNPIKKPLG